MNWIRCRYSKQTMMRYILASLLLFVSSPIMFAQPAPQPGESLSESDYRKRDLEIKSRAIDVEEKKAWTSALTTSVPIVVALFALVGTIIAARRTLIANFTAKAAELALQGEGPEEIINRATLLGELYKDLLPNNFVARVKKLDANKIGRIVTQAPWASELQKEVVSLLAEHPIQRQQIIADYKSMFPDYEFLNKLAAASSKSAHNNLQPKEPPPAVDKKE